MKATTVVPLSHIKPTHHDKSVHGHGLPITIKVNNTHSKHSGNTIVLSKNNAINQDQVMLSNLDLVYPDFQHVAKITHAIANI